MVLSKKYLLERDGLSPIKINFLSTSEISKSKDHLYLLHLLIEQFIFIKNFIPNQFREPLKLQKRG